MKQKFKSIKKREVKVYLILRFLVVVTLILQLLHGNYENVFLCILTLILFLVPFIINHHFKIELPDTLEIAILLFIFGAEILGEIQNFYGIFKNWDTMLHTINGFLAAAIGFSLIDILNKSDKLHLKLSPAFVALSAFTFSMTIGITWEIFEYSADKFLGLDMQKDTIVENISSVKLNIQEENKPIKIKNIKSTNIYYEDEIYQIEGYLDIGLNDTMKDLIVNFIGAAVFSILGWLYIRNRDKYNIVTNFIPRMKS